MPTPRTADPYRDLAVIDSRAAPAEPALHRPPRAAALATGAPWPLALGALQLSVTLLLGRRYCLACRIYFDVLQPRFGRGAARGLPSGAVREPGRAPPSSGAPRWPTRPAARPRATSSPAPWRRSPSSPPRPASAPGCTLYRGWAFLRGVRGATPGHVDLAELGAPPGRDAVIQFTHPLCARLPGRCRRASRPPDAPPCWWTSRGAPTWRGSTAWRWCRSPSPSGPTGASSTGCTDGGGRAPARAAGPTPGPSRLPRRRRRGAGRRAARPAPSPAPRAPAAPRRRGGSARRRRRAGPRPAGAARRG